MTDEELAKSFARIKEVGERMGTALKDVAEAFAAAANVEERESDETFR